MDTCEYNMGKVALPGIGAPSIGKGSRFTDMVARFPQAQTMSTGDAMREYAQSAKPGAAQIADVLKSGGLVSDDKILEMIGDYLRTKQEAPFLLLDGAPRTRYQAEQLPLITPIAGVLYFHLDAVPVDEQNKILLQRQQYRIEARKAARKPVREDDTPETLLERIETYRRELPGILDACHARRIEIIGIDSTGTPEEINRRFARELERVFARYETKAGAWTSKAYAAGAGGEYARHCINDAFNL